ncbi:DUF2971 domain-containing protein [Aeromonas caviae]|jgi:hypothetical protein|uniref:DUF2971 domain-containing protein n=1 Tax=Aeromonas caviae TaxID=648 RepID=UPI002B485923|nr:DUF2971 domain-containing protein [Aeromonas caviae]
MAIFYKYYSHLPLEFFDEPTLKISSPIHLNDPFESLLPGDIVEYINELDEINIKNYSKEQVIGALRDTMTMNGVISFSETQRNLLMWAHYADDHKGMCIGFDTDEILFDDTKEKLKQYAKIQKVNYDTVRHDFFEDMKNIKKPDLLHHYIVNKVMLTKGDSWIYEKEHRYLIPTSKADYIKVKKSDLINDKKLNLTINKMMDMNVIEKCKEIKKESDYITYVPTSSEQAAGSGYLNSNKQVSYYLRVNPKSIKKIYFGCRAPEEYTEKVKEIISKNSSMYESLYIGKMKLDNKRFELFIPSIN